MIVALCNISFMYMTKQVRDDYKNLFMKIQTRISSSNMSNTTSFNGKVNFKMVTKYASYALTILMLTLSSVCVCVCACVRVCVCVCVCG